MPPVERMLATLRRATTLVRATPGRTGHLVQLPEGAADVLVAGDLHGHLPNLQAMLAVADLANRPQRHFVVQEMIHGHFEYPNNGGDRSHQLLDVFAALKCQYPARVHYLPGNHELSEWTGRAIGKGDAAQNGAFRRGVTTAYGDASAEVYAAYQELLKSLPLALRTPNAVFVSHSLIPGRQMLHFDARRLLEYRYADADYLPGGFVYAMLWGRDTAEQTVDDYLRKVDCDWLITGHIPTDEGFAFPNHKQLVVDASRSPAAYALIPANRPLTLRMT